MQNLKLDIPKPLKLVLTLLHFAVTFLLALSVLMFWMGGLGGLIGVGFDTPSTFAEVSTLLYALFFTGVFLAAMSDLYVVCYGSLVGLALVSLLNNLLKSDSFNLTVLVLLTLAVWALVGFNYFGKNRHRV